MFETSKLMGAAQIEAFECVHICHSDTRKKNIKKHVFLSVHDVNVTGSRLIIHDLKLYNFGS